MLHKIFKSYFYEAEPEAVARSQVYAFVKQIPLLYFLMITNATILGFVHFGVVPNVLSIWIPGFMNIFCFIRLVVWLNNRNKSWSHADSLSILRKFRVYSLSLTFVIFTWTIFLAAYGNSVTRQELAFFGVLTINTITICQLQVRGIAFFALILTAVAMFIHWLCYHDAYALLRATEEFACVAVLLYTINLHYKSFVDLVLVRESLVDQNNKMKNLSDENFRMANQDSLTGIANRRSFFHELGEKISNINEKNVRFAVGLVDLDGFKTVNDVYGHGVGDILLKIAAIRLINILGHEAFVARLGGDEFALILPYVQTEEEIHAIGLTIQSALAAPFQIEAASAQVSGSIGFAIFPDAGTTEHELYDHADHALYYAKTFARGSTVVFSKEHEQAIRLDALVEQSLRSADFETEFSLVYQPIVSAHTDQTVAFEALARWVSPALGSVSPAQFIPMAERIDLIGTMTVALFRKALADLVRWPPHIRLSFNLSARDIVSPATMLRLVALIAEFKVSASRIDFEITETVLLSDFELTSRSIVALENLGAKIVLDDFGTGYSSLAYVNKLPLDKIKVDQSFTRQIETDAGSRNIVHSIVKLCRTLSLRCVVEGVETAAQADIVRDFDCDFMQGYFFARPMAAEHVVPFLARDADEVAKRAAIMQ